MDVRKHLVEAATLIVAAILCALVSNALASRERKLALVGLYPNAQKVPVQSTGTLPSLANAPAATTTATATVPMPATTSSMPVAATPMTMTIAPARPGPSTATTPARTTTTKAAAATTTPATAPAPVSPATSPSAADVLKRFPAHPDKAYVEIAFDDVNALRNAGVLFLDARRTSIYEQGHIAGARPFSVWESDIDDKVRKLFDERSTPEQQALPIVIYCSGGECEDSHMLAQKLWGIEFNNVYVYRDGFPDWQKRGGAVHVGTAP